MNKFLIYTTIALVGVGLMVFVTEYVVPIPQGTVYKDAIAFNEAYKSQIEAGEVPVLPACAETIELDTTEDTVGRIDFICADQADRDAYMTFIAEEYDWYIAETGGDRLSLQRTAEGE